MTAGAIITMVLTMGVVTVMVTYFFIKVLRAPGPGDTTSGDRKDA